MIHFAKEGLSVGYNRPVRGKSPEPEYPRRYKPERLFRRGLAEHT